MTVENWKANVRAECVRMTEAFVNLGDLTKNMPEVSEDEKDELSAFVVVKLSKFFKIVEASC